MDLVCVQTFSDYVEAHIVMGALQNEGIKCWLKDENIVTINPLFTNAVGGIKLMVAEDQQQDARKILQQLDEEKKKKYTCTHCGSSNIQFITSNRKPVNWFSKIAGLFLLNHPIGAKQIWHCFDCGGEFE